MDNLSSCFDFENQIKIDEKKSYQKFISAVKRISNNEVSECFQEPVQKEIIQAIEKIGLDKNLIKTLFMIAAPAWHQMKFDTHNSIVFQPFMVKKISDVQIGIIEELNNNNSYFINFHTPWIVLPRVYDHLNIDDFQTLPTYIEFLKQSKNIEFKKILIHIIITYFGNYSLKFISNNHMRRSVSDMLFYGYLSMFWKNLRNPPKGFEDCLIFKNFLKSIQFFPRKMCFFNKDKSRQINKMENALKNIFPKKNTFGVYSSHEIDPEKLFLALRHGPEGIKIVLDHFCVDPNLIKEKSNGGIPHEMLPESTWGFLKLIKKRYKKETSKTKEFIQEFNNKLYNNYSKASFLSKNSAAKQDEFVKQRVFRIIRDFTI